MHTKECIAMLLAGGQGSRLGPLTKKLAKPAVPFGGKYRIIDFTLTNCRYSGIDTIGVLTQYKPLVLNNYIGIGSAWELDRKNGGLFILPPYTQEKEGEWYCGTADAIYQNLNFVDSFSPSYVLILSGDHIYKMDYSKLIKYHKAQNADATIAVIEVPWEEASRFGIMNTDRNNKITEFVEKPKKPKNNLASMGVYVFNWTTLKKYLKDDAKDGKSNHDFGKNIIPKMLFCDRKMYAYRFEGYWKDVGTVESYWEANMDLLGETPKLNIYDPEWNIYTLNPTRPPHYMAGSAKVIHSIISDGCRVYGEVCHSVLFPNVYIGKGAKIKDSIVMAHTFIDDDVVIDKAVVGRKAIIKKGCRIGLANEVNTSAGITIISDNMAIPFYTQIDSMDFDNKKLDHGAAALS